MAKNMKAASAFDVTSIIPEKESKIKESTPAVQQKRRVVKRETKSKRVNLLVRPSVYDALVEKADYEGVSVNELVNNFMEQIIKN